MVGLIYKSYNIWRNRVMIFDLVILDLYDMHAFNLKMFCTYDIKSSPHTFHTNYKNLVVLRYFYIKGTLCLRNKYNFNSLEISSMY
jgi:hypothetical protein